MKKNTIECKGLTKWTIYFNLTEMEKKEFYIATHVLTKNTKLLWLQLRIKHNIICTNSFLFKIGVLNDQNCTFCHEFTETIDHLFWECDKVKELLLNLQTFCTNTLDEDFQFSKKEFIIGSKVKIPKNILCLQLKYYIYVMRCNDKSLSLMGTLFYFKNFLASLKFTAIKENNFDQFRLFWNKWMKLLENSE